jgi:hypothetical protein
MSRSTSTIIVFLFSTLLLTNISGQVPGFRAGWNNSSMLFTDTEVLAPYDPQTYTYKPKTGFNAGITLEMPVFTFFSFETGLFLNTRGRVIRSVEDFGGTLLTSREKHELYYIDLPLVAKLHFDAGKFDIYASAGPYVSYGVAGRSISKHEFGDLTENDSREIRWGTEVGVDDYARTDYGYVFGTGIEAGRFIAGISYAVGMTNISPEKNNENGSTLENRLFSISAGYRFGKKIKDRSEMAHVVLEEVKSDRNVKTKISAKNSQQAEEERIYRERLREDSLVAIRAESERLRVEKEKADSIAAATERERIIQLERAELEKAKADSIVKAAEQQSIKKPDVIVYRVQVASSVHPKGSYKIEVEGKSYQTWEYLYSGAHRSTAGEFSSLKPAVELQNALRKAGYPQAFVVAFKNGIRTIEPSLFK